MNLFRNSLKLRGFLGKDAEEPQLTRTDKVPYIVLTVCMDDGFWWRPANEWLSHGGWFRVICPSAAFCDSLKEMKQGDYVEIRGQLIIHHYAEVNLNHPVYEVHALRVRRLKIPAVGVVEDYDG